MTGKADWYCRIHGQRVGPLMAGQLKQKAESGEITLNSVVRKGENGRWRHAMKIKGLFPSIKCENSDCLKSFKVEPHWVGRRIKCPRCKLSQVYRSSNDHALSETPENASRMSPKKRTSREESPLAIVYGTNRISISDLSSDGEVHVRTSAKGIIRYRGMLSRKTMRDDLLSGKITRADEARRVVPHKNYSIEKTKWSPIGVGLAKEDDDIQALYEPKFICVKSALESAYVLGAIATFIAALVKLAPKINFLAGLSSPKDSGESGNHAVRGIGEDLSVHLFTQAIHSFASNPAAVAIVGGLILLFVAFMIAGTLGHLFVPVGYLWGLAYYEVKNFVSPFPRPPEDGFEAVKESTLLTGQCFIRS